VPADRGGSLSARKPPFFTGDYLPAPGPQITVVVGGRESAEFHRQAES
jgi:hypothetical protein